jgi:aryl carrier-like protein
MLLEMLKHTDGDWATMAPLTLETISKNITLLDEIAPRLQMLLFSGGSLPKVFGDVIATKIRLTSLLGSSESGPLPTIYRQGYDFERDWNYLQIHPAVGAKFDQVSADVFELVFHRSPKSELHQTVFTLYPDLQMYRTKDLFTPHPTLPDTWTHASRSDDVIFFLNGEKVNPIVFESNISKYPEVAAALMFGQQRFEAGLLIEPANSNNAISAIERARLIQQIWPAIEQANRLLPGYAQVSQSHICFTDPGSPILRTLKGSIRRPATLELYAAKINQLYTDVEAIWTPVNNRMEVDITEDSLQKLVKHQVLDITSLSDINQNENFFNRGMDSLQVLRLVRVLRMKTSLREIQPSTIYLHPTVELLARALHEMAHHTSGPKNGKNKDLLNTRLEILEKHIGKIDEIQVAESRSLTKADKEVVLLTGSTGTIGSHILRALLQDIRVKHIYCLNRSPDSATLQLERNKSLDASLPSVFPEDKITFLTAELSEPTSLDLPADIYKNLC